MLYRLLRMRVGGRENLRKRGRLRRMFKFLNVEFLVFFFFIFLGVVIGGWLGRVYFYSLYYLGFSFGIRVIRIVSLFNFFFMSILWVRMFIVLIFFFSLGLLISLFIVILILIFFLNICLIIFGGYLKFGLWLRVILFFWLIIV